MTRQRKFHAVLTSLLLSLAIATPVALADPPPHAPAHGWRKKHDPYYVGYTGRHWTDDYGIRDQGRCNRSHVATALGAVAGAVIGDQVAGKDNRVIAILAGAAVGALIGREIDQHMDRNDRGCFGHSLELLEDRRSVRWDGAKPGMLYTMTPTSRFERDGRVCRDFVLVREWQGQRIKKYGKACRSGEGEWRMVG